MTTDQQATRAIEMAKGLRALADMIEANPEMAELLGYAFKYISQPVDTREDVVAFTRAASRAGAQIKKDFGSSKYAKVHASFGPVTVDVFIDRDQVCKRIVTGTREVTEEIPDPEAVASVPLVTVTKVVEDVEWRCMPLLADALTPTEHAEFDALPTVEQAVALGQAATSTTVGA